MSQDIALAPHLRDCSDISKMAARDVEDYLLTVRLIAALPDEPDLRSTWLLSYHEGEGALAAIIGDRLSRAHGDYEVRLCAASVMHGSGAGD